MCGIAGIVRLRAAGAPAITPDELGRLSHELAHRGPDDFGFLGWRPQAALTAARDPSAAAGGRVGLVHRRLSILDTSECGAQPMVSADGRYAIVYNGEIYNYVELRAELCALGHRFRSSGDTEVLLHAWAEWGPAVLPRLEGMFAFAILDTATGTVTLARDHFGIKPLYYLIDDLGLTFASELGALVRLRATERRVDPVALFRYLRFGITDIDERTLLEGIQHLPPAHLLEIRGDGTVGTPRRFWSLTETRRTDLSFDEAAREVRDRFLGNVERHLRSDVPVGACLSGGIDSSACVAAMRHLDPNLELHTFSYVADDARVNEERWARIVGDHAKATMHTISPAPASLPETLDRLIATQGEPFASTSIYAQHRVFELVAQQGIKVVLDGQGADELFGGYFVYMGARLASLMRAGKYTDAVRLWRNASRRPGHGRAPLIAAQYLLPDSVQEPFRRLVRREVAPAWLDARWFAERGVEPAAHRARASRDLLRAELTHSLGGTLRGLLRYEDRNSMAYSIESRVPFLTPAFAEFALSLPEEYLISEDGTTKAVFRRAMRGIVPDAILDRADKIGFQTPEQRWMAELRPWVDRILDGEAARAIPALDHKAMLREWSAVQSDPTRYNPWVWRWINLARWVELSNVRFA